MKASATVSVESGFISERQSVYIVFHHDDARPYRVFLSKIWQNIDALDYVFNQLLQEGKLDKKYPTLSIRAHRLIQLEDPQWHSPTVLSMEENCFIDLDGHNVRTDELIELGSCYKISATVRPLSYENLLTLILLLPRLTPENPRIEIETLEEFKRYKQEVALERERFRNITFEREISWSPCGQFLLKGTWENQKIHYQIINFETKEKINLDSLDHYLFPPAWSFNSRFVVYGSSEKIKIFDLDNNKKTTIDLRQLLDRHVKYIIRKEHRDLSFIVNPQENKILLFSFDAWLVDPMVVYIWDSQTNLLERVTEVPERLRWRMVEGTEFENWVRIPEEVKRVTLDQFETMIKGELCEELKKLEPYRSRILEKYESFYGGEISPLKNRIALITSEDDLLRVKVVEIDDFEEIDVNKFTIVAEFAEPIIPEEVVDEVRVDEKVNWLLVLLGVASIIIIIIFIGFIIYQKRNRSLRSLLCVNSGQFALQIKRNKLERLSKHQRNSQENKKNCLSK